MIENQIIYFTNDQQIEDPYQYFYGISADKPFIKIGSFLHKELI